MGRRKLLGWAALSAGMGGRAPLRRVIAVDVQQEDAAAARLQVPPEQGAQEGPPFPCMNEGC